MSMPTAQVPPCEGEQCPRQMEWERPLSTSAATPKKAWLCGTPSLLPAWAAGERDPKEGPPGNWGWGGLRALPDLHPVGFPEGTPPVGGETLEVGRCPGKAFSGLSEPGFVPSHG